MKETAGGVYDAYCKRILCHKQILAYILKECVEEYREVPLAQLPYYIEPTVQHQDTARADEAIRGMNSEDEKILGALIRYDIFFEAALPKQEGALGLLVNLEAQNKDDPSYRLISRAIYYCSRLLARQKNAPEGFSHSTYDRIKKVYSIWICIRHSRKKDGVINTYAITETCLQKRWNSPKSAYDLMKAVMIYPRKEAIEETKGSHDLLELLHLLFVSKQSVQVKSEQLRKNYGIMMTKELEEEVETMCNLSEGIWEEGVAQGMAQGRAQNSLEMSVAHVRRLMEKMNMSVREAMEILGIADRLRPLVVKELAKEGK